MSHDTEESGSWLEAAGEAVEGVVGVAADLAEVEVVGLAETAYHAGAGVGAAVTGNWEGAGHHMGDMANSALNVVSGGLLGATELGWDATATGARAAGASAAEAPTSAEVRHHGLDQAGEWLGDTVYDLVHGDGSGAGE